MSQHSGTMSDGRKSPTLLDYALAYARLGWSVVPLHSVTLDGQCTCRNPACGKHTGKHPRTPHGVHDATTDEAQIRQWWTKWPDANIGIATGNVSGILVLDVDPRHGGDEELRKLFKDNGEFPLTPVVSTGGGGWHYYLAMPPFPVKNMTDKSALSPGVEVKSDGGIVVAPPSKHMSGNCYEWVTNPKHAVLAEVPEWLAKLLRNAMEEKPKQCRGESIPEGQRNVTLTSIAGSLRRKGYTENQILDSLLKINRTRCQPPLPEKEVAQIARSVSRYAPGSEKPVTTDVVKMYPLTDLGNAERLVERYGKDIRYCAVWKQWLVWDGKRWVKDTKLQVRQKAYETVRSIYQEAAQCADDVQRQALAKHALASESERRIQSMISLAQALPGIAVVPEQLDTDRWILNVANGTIDLRNGELRPHNRGDYITKLANVVYDPQAKCPTWEKFLQRIMDGNDRLIRFLQKAIGYSLTGDVSEQVIFFLYGNTGKNGKSTFLNTIKSLLGDYALNMQPETLMVRQHRGINNDVARLAGVRFVAAVEGDEGQRLSEGLVKQMTGGDTITARFLYQEQFDFQPSHKIFFATNHKPVIRGTDDAIWRRIRLIPFSVTIPEHERDPRLPEKLKAELPGILRWAVEGCLLWQEEGLGMPPEVEQAVSQYRSEMDVIARFIADCCVEHISAKATSAALYDAYVRWCDENGERPLSQRVFGMKLSERGYQSTRTASSRMWVGIGLRASQVTQVTHSDAKISKSGTVVPFIKTS